MVGDVCTAANAMHAHYGLCAVRQCFLWLRLTEGNQFFNTPQHDPADLLLEIETKRNNEIKLKKI